MYYAYFNNGESRGDLPFGLSISIALGIVYIKREDAFMARYIIAIIVLIFVLPLNSEAQSFTNPCVTKQGTSSAKTFVELGAREAVDAQNACGFISLGGVVPAGVYGDVKSMTSRKFHDPKAEASCLQFGENCKLANRSNWSAYCCAVSFTGK